MLLSHVCLFFELPLPPSQDHVGGSNANESVANEEGKEVQRGQAIGE